MEQIIDRLWLGSAVECYRLTPLKQNKITTILNVASDWNDPIENTEFVWYKVGFVDGYGATLEDIDKAVRILTMLYKNGETVYVHCAAGVSRSPIVVCIFLAKLLKISLDNALEMVKQKREGVRPAKHLIKVAREYLEKY